MLHWVEQQLQSATSGLLSNFLWWIIFGAGGILYYIWRGRTGRKELALPEGRQVYQKVEPVQWDAATQPTPSVILNWKSRFVRSLIGRDAMLGDLQRWSALRRGRDFRIYLVTGAGGSGKTRLAAEFAYKRQEALRFPWTWLGRHFRTVGFASEAIKTQLPALLILDDQESVREDILTLLTSLAEHKDVRHPVRVLLVCRTASTDAWRKAIQNERGLIDALEPGDFVLPPLEHGKAVELFLAALAALGITEQRRETVRAAITQWLQTDDDVRRLPLYTIAAAVAYKANPEALVGYTHQDVIQALAQRERARIRESVKTNGRLQPEVAERLIALTTLHGSLTFDDLRSLADADLEIGLPDANTIADRVRESGIVWQGSGEAALVAPEPQLLANVLAWQVLCEPEIASRVPEAIYHTIAMSRAGEEARIASRMSRLLLDVSLIFGKGVERAEHWWGAMLAKAETRAERARNLEYLSATGQPYLESLAIDVLKALVENESDGDRRAGLRNNLGNALQTLGARESGTEHLEEAVRAYRAALEEHTRERVPLQWAMTQNNLGNALERIGDKSQGNEAARVGLRST